MSVIFLSKDIRLGFRLGSFFFFCRLLTIEPKYTKAKQSLWLLSTWCDYHWPIKSIRAFVWNQVTVIHSLAIHVTVTSERRVKPSLRPWKTVQTRIRRRRMRRLIRVCIVSLNCKKLRVKWNMSQDHFPSLHSETIDLPVLSVLWLSPAE